MKKNFLRENNPFLNLPVQNELKANCILTRAIITQEKDVIMCQIRVMILQTATSVCINKRYNYNVFFLYMKTTLWSACYDTELLKRLFFCASVIQSPKEVAIVLYFPFSWTIWGLIWGKIIRKLNLQSPVHYGSI